MKKYEIYMINYFGDFKVCDWEAKSREEAVKEFLEINSDYSNKGKIIARGD